MSATFTELKILRLLSSSGGMFGLQIVKESNGEIKRGSVYTLLGRMEDKGLVESSLKPRKDKPESQRRIYKTTGLGERILLVNEVFTTQLERGWV